MRATILLVLLIAASAAAQEIIQVQPPAPPKFFVVHFTAGPKWNQAIAPNQQEGFSDHSANLKRLRDEKRILLGARYGAKGMVVVAAQDLEEVRALLAPDKTLENGVFEAAIDEFKPFYDGCVNRK